jgi:hypothetical protein
MEKKGKKLVGLSNFDHVFEDVCMYLIYGMHCKVQMPVMNSGASCLPCLARENAQVRGCENPAGRSTYTLA